MASKKISELPAAGALTGTELVEVVKGGVNTQTTAQDIANLGAGGGGTVTSVTGTSNRITSTGGATPVIDIDAAYDAAVTAEIAAAVSGLAPLASPALTGTPTAPTAAAGTNTTQVATTAFVRGEVVGVKDLPIPAQAMWPRVTSGCSVLTQYEMATSLLNLQGLEFSSTVQQFAQMDVPLPRAYTSGVITAVIHWKPLASGSGDVRWGIQLASYRNDDALTTAFGTEVAVTDTFIATDDLHITTVSGTITPSGTLAAGNLLALQINRDPTNGSDTLDVNAILLSVVVRLTMSAAIDA